MDNLEKRIKINGVINGLLLGVILTALSIFSYYFITAITSSPVLFVAGPIMFSVFIPIFAVVLFCFNARKKIGGYWTFRQATTGIFIMFLTAYLVQFAGKNLIFDKVIEPNNVQMTQNAAINAKVAILKERKTDPRVIERNIIELKKDFNQQKNLTVGNTIQGMVFSILFVFLFALIFASLFKREPGFVNTNTP
ncbi:MAG: hypothetical protein JWP44_2426 [Mucilaginibacter sp.]|nr:hypothetical protein [Mucilaginibacter sp.]